MGGNWIKARAPTGSFSEHIKVYTLIFMILIHDYCSHCACKRERPIVVPPSFLPLPQPPYFYIEICAVDLQIFFNFHDSLKLFSNYGSLPLFGFSYTFYTASIFRYCICLNLPLKQKQIRMTH